MTEINQTSVNEFILLGFQDLHNLQGLLFFLLLFIYGATITGNLLIILLTVTSTQLWSPMYFFLSHLSFCDILISTEVGPNALQVILLGRSPISVLSCHMQFYFFGASIITECSLLSVMSYDRYLAICKPLHYSLIMTRSLPQFLAGLCWVAGFICSMIGEFFVLQLEFCGPNIIDHFFCDLTPVLKLACSDTRKVEIFVSVLVFMLGILQALFVLVTYVCIFTSTLRISSISGRRKTFSTCSSHLAVVSIFYGSLFALYISPSTAHSRSLNKVLSLFNTMITPLFNPIIYSLRNKEIRLAFSKNILKKYLFESNFKNFRQIVAGG